MPNITFGVLAKLGPPPPRITVIASGGLAGGYALRADSTKWSWGQNLFGELGNNTIADRYTPTSIIGTFTFAHISKGQYFGVGVTTAGVGYAWGANDQTQLGINSNVSQRTPVGICGGITWNKIYANWAQVGANAYAIGISTTGVAYGWGIALEGRLGTNNTTQRSTPVQVCGGHNFCKLSVGLSHTVAINSAGQAYSWGNNTSGKLGDNSITNRCMPVAVCGGHNFCEVSCSLHSLAINSVGQAYAWGVNGSGELGNNSTVSQRTPVAICGGLNFCKIAAGSGCSFGITDTGNLYSWGSSNYGELAQGATIARSTPTLVTALSNVCDILVGAFNNVLAITKKGKLYSWGRNAGALNLPVCMCTPVAFPSGYNFCSISVGSFGTTNYMLDNNGKAWTVGRNFNSERGIGTTSTAPEVIATPTLVSGGGSGYKKLVGSRDTACLIDSLDGVYCWGLGTSGQIGNNAATTRCTPTGVCVGVLVFTDIGSGLRHVAAITSTGVAYAWGSGLNGALGRNSTANASTPVAVCGGLNFCKISVGNDYNIGITNTNAAYAWGSNTNGKLGDNTAVSKSTPVLVSGGLSWGQISCGDGFTAGITTTGVAYGWGINTNGQLGNNSITDRSVPTAVCGGLTFCKIAVGQNHTCGLNSSGQAYCWGQGTGGELGDNTLVSKRTPVAVCGGYNFCNIQAGASWTTAVTNTGQIYSWGVNATDTNQYNFGNGINITTPNLVTYI